MKINPYDLFLKPAPKRSGYKDESCIGVSRINNSNVGGGTFKLDHIAHQIANVILSHEQKRYEDGFAEYVDE